MGLGGCIFCLCLEAISRFNPLAFIFQCRIALPDRAQYSVPEGEEGLREVGLDAPTLVVNVMVCSIVASNVLQWIPRQCVSAVVVNSFDGRADEEENPLFHAHIGNLVCYPSTQRIEEKAFDWMII